MISNFKRMFYTFFFYAIMNIGDGMKKGFTLVEVMAVVIVLSVIAVVSFTSLTKSIKDAQIKEEKTFVTNVTNASSTYIETNLDNIDELKEVGEEYIFTLNDLIEGDYLPSDISNPTDCDNENIQIKATKNSRKIIEYEVSCTNPVKVYGE